MKLWFVVRFPLTYEIVGVNYSIYGKEDEAVICNCVAEGDLSRFTDEEDSSKFCNIMRRSYGRQYAYEVVEVDV